MDSRDSGDLSGTSGFSNSYEMSLNHEIPSPTKAQRKGMLAKVDFLKIPKFPNFEMDGPRSRNVATVVTGPETSIMARVCDILPV